MRAALATAAQALAAEDVRLVPAENLHVTISFLGSVEAARAADIAAALTVALERTAPIPTQTAALGAFPSPGRARVVWAGLADPAGHLARVAGRTQEALASEGFTPEERAWTPHVTLARLNRPRAADLSPPVPPVAFEIDGVTLFRSHLGRPAPRYEALAVVRFG